MASTSTGTVRANRYCCIVGCSNSERKNLKLKFYCFPSQYQDWKRRKFWIKAVNRCDNEGKLWQPKQHSRICGEHFVNGIKSNDPNSESFHPTIFPDIYYTDPQTHNATKGKHIYKQKKRFTDILVKTTKFSLETNETSSQKDDIKMQDDFISTYTIKQEPEECKKIPVKMSTVGIQTDPWWDQPPNESNILFCWNDGNDSSTQTEIYIRKYPFMKREKIEFPTKSKTFDTGCCPDINMQRCFMGFSDIDTDKIMYQLAGVSREFFFILLSFIVPKHDGQPAYFRKLIKENRLLLFLMKIKLGISFCSLGCLFHIHETLASTIFFQILTTLTEKTKNLIFWPTREIVQSNLPSVLIDNYQNCRCIIDCTEIRSDAPSTVKDKLLMYSNNKDDFTIKFLIAVTPDGLIRNVSKGYVGKATDCFITKDCGILNLIESGDLILADEGFSQIKSEFEKRNATLIDVLPSFHCNSKFNHHENNDTYKLTSIRIQVQRAIERVKKLRILDHFSVQLMPYTDAIMQLCCVIANSGSTSFPEVNDDDC